VPEEQAWRRAVRQKIRKKEAREEGGVRTVCRGACTLDAVPKKIGPMYAAGFGWCTTCAEWFDLGRVSCPCCGQPLRRRARRNVGVAGGNRGDRPPLRRASLLPPPTAAAQAFPGATGIAATEVSG